MTDNPLDETLDALSNLHRRQLLLELRKQNHHGEVPDASYGNTPPDTLTLAMTHVHLPKLSAYDFIEWDRESGTVTRGPAFERVEPILDVLYSEEAVLPDSAP